MRSWSVSSIRSFHGCQLAWWFRRTGVEPAFKALALVQGIVLHETLAHHLRGMRDGKTPTEEDALGLLEATLFFEEASGPVAYGKKTREEILDRLRALYRHWRETWSPAGTIVGVEEKIHVQLPGLDLPLLGYADAVVRTRSRALEVIDWKVVSSRPWADPELDTWDLQKLAMTRGYEAQSGQLVQEFSWVSLVKTKKPQVVTRTLGVERRRRDADLLRLADTVNPTLVQMDAVLEGWLPAVPSAAFGRMCRTCPYREPCVFGAHRAHAEHAAATHLGARAAHSGSR